MRHSKRESAGRLGKALRQVYNERRRREFEPSEFWVAGVMSEIRRIGWLNAASDFWSALEGLIWKFIPAAIAFLLLLAVAFSQIDPAPDDTLADIYSGGSLESELYAFYDR